jgi:Ca2+-binding EF-hand superfamily protein
MELPDVMKFFKELDTDNSGTLSFEEYIEFVFQLRYPLISDLVKFDIKRTGVSDVLKEKVEVKPEEKINLMEASGFMTRSRHRFNFESKLSEEQKENFGNLFKVYDKDGSGTIDIMELNNVLNQLGYTFSPDSLDIIIHIVDDNMDGILNFQEFLGLYDFLEYLKSLFESADGDKSGSIDREELKNLLVAAGYKFNEKQVELFYKMCDEDGSGKIEVSDFFALTLFIFWAQILFAKADTDGNDSIEVNEFNNALKRLGILMPPEGVAKYFNELDTDQSGTLNFEEYMELIFMVKFLEVIFG